MSIGFVDVIGADFSQWVLFSIDTKPILTKIDKMHSWEKRIQVCSMKDQANFKLGTKHSWIKIRPSPLCKDMFSRTVSHVHVSEGA